MEDLEGWELIPGHDDRPKKLLPTGVAGGSDDPLNSGYLLCSPINPISSQFADFTSKDDNLVPLPSIQIPPIEKMEEDPLTLSAGAMEVHQDPVTSSLSLDKNMEETKFVDIKSLDDHQGEYSFEGEEEEAVIKSVGDQEVGSGGLDIWKWSWTGIGALCSFGVATVCIVVLGGSKDGGFKQYHHEEGKEAVVKHATKWNEAISAVRGGSVPLTRAHITFGGYYDARL